jgi:hypothetical protein
MKGLLMKLSAFDTLSVCFHIVENPVTKQEVMVSSALALIQSAAGQIGTIADYCH